MRILIIVTFALLTVGTAYGQLPTIDKGEAEKALKSEIPKVSYCELIRNPKLYNQKYVRVHGTYRFVGGEYTNLFDLTCYGNLSPTAKLDAQTETWLWFDQLFESFSEADVVKVFKQLKSYEHEADVVVVGKFYGSDKHGGYGHLGIAKYQLVVVRMDEVKPVRRNN